MSLANIQLVALGIIRKNVAFLVILGLFPFAVGLRKHDGALVSYTSWAKLVSYAVVLPTLYFAMRLIVALIQGAIDAKKDRDRNMVFGGAIGYELLLAGVAIMMITLGFSIYIETRHLDVSDDLTMAILAGVFWAWPRRVEFSNGAIIQRKILGGTKSILLTDVATVKFDANQQCIIVTGKNGVQIVHSMFHARRSQFARELTHFTGLPVPGFEPALAPHC